MLTIHNYTQLKQFDYITGNFYTKMYYNRMLLTSVTC